MNKPKVLIPIIFGFFCFFVYYGYDIGIIYSSEKQAEKLTSTESFQQGATLTASSTYIDTISYDDGNPCYYFGGSPGDTLVCWFSPEFPCSLLAVQYLCYSPGGYTGGVWWAPEYGDSTFTGGLGEALVCSLPVNEYVNLDSFRVPFDMDTFDFFVGLFWDAYNHPMLVMDIEASHFPPRSYKFVEVWRALPSDVVIRAIVLYYQNEAEEETEVEEETNIRLHQNYPNPFYDITTIKYTIPKDTPISLKIYDLSGRLVETLLDNSKFPINLTNSINWSAKGVPSGIYFVKLTANAFTQTQKLILFR